ncbi:hypothetical protein [Streptomyces neyagawaensis]|nr:hypothetical protein [Streptomyces neyagawaensis]MDE1685004.1 hypothetical protein [Streptomyces neyagawaensis]
MCNIAWVRSGFLPPLRQFEEGKSGLTTEKAVAIVTKLLAGE